MNGWEFFVLRLLRLVVDALASQEYIVRDFIYFADILFDRSADHKRKNDLVSFKKPSANIDVQVLGYIRNQFRVQLLYLFWIKLLYRRHFILLHWLLTTIFVVNWAFLCLRRLFHFHLCLVRIFSFLNLLLTWSHLIVDLLRIRPTISSLRLFAFLVLVLIDDLFIGNINFMFTCFVFLVIWKSFFEANYSSDCLIEFLFHIRQWILIHRIYTGQRSYDKIKYTSSDWNISVLLSFFRDGFADQFRLLEAYRDFFAFLFWDC